ncbi:MAG: acyltransferase, partial [Muribaculaceae bacterium]|nr:acyltransferase [Muribaculaceae bacterium]
MQHPRHQGFLKYVAYLQAIGIILVVFGHSFHEYPDGDYGRTLTVYRMMYSFRMPLFLFVSGFLMVFTMRLRGASRRSWGAFAREKCVRLMIPLVFLSAVAYVPRVLMSHMADEPVELGLKPFVASFIDSSSLTIPYFWFLHVSFLLLLLTYGVVLVADRFKASRVAALALLAVAIAAMWLLPVEWPTVFSVNEAVRLGVYFVAGALFGELSEQVDRYVPWHSWRLFSVLALAWAG